MLFGTVNIVYLGGGVFSVPWLVLYKVNNNNNNNNNNIYLLQVGCYPVAVVKPGGLREKHVVATWNLGDHLSICF